MVVSGRKNVGNPDSFEVNPNKLFVLRDNTLCGWNISVCGRHVEKHDL